jgi:hypothetical protein
MLNLQVVLKFVGSKYMYFSLINSFPNPFACKLQNSFCNPKQIKFHLFNSYKVLIRKKKKFKKIKK